MAIVLSKSRMLRLHKIIVYSQLLSKNFVFSGKTPGGILIKSVLYERIRSVAISKGDQWDRPLLKFERLLKKVKNWDFVSDIMHSDSPT